MKDITIKERLFALYIGSQTYDERDFPKRNTLNGMIRETAIIQYNEEDQEILHSYRLTHEKCRLQLLLRSIDSLTDEECIEVAKICSVHASDHVVKFGKDICKVISSKRHYEVPNLFWTTWLRVTDYLRSISIALPYLGISVEKQVNNGWVKIDQP